MAYKNIHAANTTSEKPNANRPHKTLTASASFRQPTDADICYLLNRITFGPRPGDLQAVKAIGISNYIGQQLHCNSFPEPQIIASYISHDPELTATPADLFFRYGPPAVRAIENRVLNNTAEDKSQAQKMVHQKERQLFSKFAQLRIMRAQYSPKQLQEIMTDFWFNHFNVYGGKGLDRIWVGLYEDKAIRPHALGKFRDLLGATCHHAAMLFYLDNWQNSAAQNRDSANNSQNPNAIRNRFSGLNENYARELMELHTLGVDGGYTQPDIIQLAKILTGLGLPLQGRRAQVASANQISGDYFDERRHDYSNKTLLKYSIKGSGANEIEEALDILASHPSTAHHISYQLAQYFVADKPPITLVNKLTARFTKTNGDIKAVLTELFNSNEFWDPRYHFAKYKNPFRYTISLLRATNAQPANYELVMGFLRQQGMPIYGCLTPDGYKNTKEAWLNPDTLIKRIGFATGIASGRLRKICPQPPNYAVVGTVFGTTISPNTVRVITKAPPQLKLALLLGSPEFMSY